MRLIALLLSIQFFACAIQYSVTPAKTHGGNLSNQSSRSIPISVQPAQQNTQKQSQQQIPVQVTPPAYSNTPKTPQANIGTQVTRSNSQEMQKIYGSTPSNTPQNINTQVIPPTNQTQKSQVPQSVNIQIYPATVGNQDPNSNRNLKVDVGKSRPITQDMMFYPAPVQKMKLPPRKKPKVQVAPTPKAAVYQDEYDDDDVEPLFIRNRKGVMIGAGIGGAFNRLWVGGSDGNERFYSNDFTYYFRLGYQHYFTPYLGLRAYVHLGDWSFRINDTTQIGGRSVKIASESNLNYSGYFELLYDFVVLENHSFGIFGGIGVGVGSYEFSNDETENKSDYFAMPIISAGFAYTLYLNNRFELEVKAPLRQGVIETSWRAEFSTWLFGVSYTYVF